jgi:hypothetical protein
VAGARQSNAVRTWSLMRNLGFTAMCQFASLRAWAGPGRGRLPADAPGHAEKCRVELSHGDGRPAGDGRTARASPL